MRKLAPRAPRALHGCDFPNFALRAAAAAEEDETGRRAGALGVRAVSPRALEGPRASRLALSGLAWPHRAAALRCAPPTAASDQFGRPRLGPAWPGRAGRWCDLGKILLKVRAGSSDSRRLGEAVRGASFMSWPPGRGLPCREAHCVCLCRVCKLVAWPRLRL